MKKLILTLLTIFCSVFFVNGQDRNEQLYQSIAKNEKAQVVQLLKDGANANYIKSSGPWMKVSMLITAVNNSNIEIVKLLLENKAEVNWKDGFQTTALIYAASKGNKDMVILLLDNGADINANDGQGNTVFSAAKESKNKELIKYLGDRKKN
jgi:ankyrin repeat protein